MDSIVSLRARALKLPWYAWLLLLAFGAATDRTLAASAGTDRDAEKEEVTIYRDEFGVPNIFAETAEGACFGMGYAQAEDRLEQLLRQYRLATGTMSEAFGPDYVRHDYRQRLWRHSAVSQQRYDSLSPKGRALIEAFLAGVKHRMQERPDQVPDWALEPEPWQVVALGRYIIWGWPEGTAAGDLKRGGIEADPIEARGSNQWVVAAERSALQAPIALVDPHLSFYGAFRFYEARMYAGDYAVAGMAIVGLPEISLGHNQYLSFAKTTGGPDTSDVYEETINPDNPRQYLYDGQWRDVSVRKEIIRIQEDDAIREEAFEIESTHHGPIVARRDGKAYAARLSYMDEVSLVDQNHAMITARNLSEFKESLEPLQLMEQNVMCATVDGDIFYVRNGRVPIRPAGFDFRRPVPGHLSAAEWQGIHPLADLLQIENPPEGYMQNCNVSPEHLYRGCPLVPDRYHQRPYLYNEDNPLHQRAAMVVEFLHGDDQLTLEEAAEIAMSPLVWGANLWQARLRDAWINAGESVKDRASAERMCRLILDWNGRCDTTSTGAIAYKYWKYQLGDDVLQSDRRGLPPPQDLTDAQVVEAVAKGAEQLLHDWGRLEVEYGEAYRIGRQQTDATGEPTGKVDRHWPVAGGSVPGLATPRAIGFRPLDSKCFVAHRGQTSPQLIVLTKPPKSFTMVPLGQSDDPKSSHYDDQAEKLFSGTPTLKSTYFLDKQALLDVVKDRKTITWEKRQRADMPK